MSLAQLVQVKLPEISSLLPTELKTPEKPSEDFLAVLDRALSEPRKDSVSPNDSSVHPASLENPVREQPALPRADISPNDSAHYEELRRENEVRRETAVSTRDTNAREQNVSTLAKNRDRSSSAEKAHTLQKESAKPHRLDTTRTENATLASFHQTVTHELQRQADTRLVQTLSKTHDANRPVSETPTAAKTRKISTKNPELVEIDRKDTAKPVAAKTNTAKNEHTVRLESAAARMQLHADTGSGSTKSLQGALDVVKDLARTLGLDSSGDAAKSGNKTIELSRNFAIAQTASKNATFSKSDRADSSSLKKSEDTISLRQSERFGKKGAHEALAQAKDNGRVQVLDLRNTEFKASPVLENMLASHSGASSSRGEETMTRKDSFAVLNSSYMPANPLSNSVSIPMHLVASQTGNLQQSIRNHLIEKGNNEIVQQARIVMKGQDSGEIRLILKPEALGEVRIHLQMNDGHIAGKIFVENKEVQAAFQDNMDALMQAFQDGGLSTGSMQVAVDSNGSNHSGFNFQERENDEQQKRYAVGRMENSVATVSAATHDYSQINLVV